MTHFTPARTAAFTLMETIIAMMIFSLAVVALAEAIQQAGKTSAIIRQDIQVHDRMAAMTAEASRLILLVAAGQRPQTPEAVEENGVTYKVAAEQIKGMKNKDGLLVEGIWEVTTTAEWLEGSEPQQLIDKAWVYPPLLPTLQ
jgi:type II secretory pathway component PulJ